MIYYFKADKDASSRQSIKGRMIVPAEIQMQAPEAQSSSQPEPKGPPKVHKFNPHFEVKWVLPPKESYGYEWSKDMAERVEYATVEHDDMDEYFP